jgi:hypothetical protein
MGIARCMCGDTEEVENIVLLIINDLEIVAIAGNSLTVLFQHAPGEVVVYIKAKKITEIISSQRLDLWSSPNWKRRSFR